MPDSSEPVAVDIADTWLGVPRLLDRARAESLLLALDELWQAQARSVRAKDDEDIKKAWFDPLARGARLRGALDRLPQARAVLPHLDDLGPFHPLVMEVGEGKLIVTPEGRALSTLLRQQLAKDPSGSRVRLRWADTDAVDRALLGEYRAAVLSKLESVVKLRGGSAPPLLPQAIGQVLLLLLNGNFGAERGLKRPTEVEDQHAVDAAVAAMVSNFVDHVSKSSRERDPSAYSLYSGYAMSEARRRLGSDLTLNPVSLAEGSRDRVVGRLLEELARRGIPRDQVLRALDELIQEYENRRAELAVYGLAQGRPSDAAVLRRAFKERYRNAVDSDD